MGCSKDDFTWNVKRLKQTPTLSTTFASSITITTAGSGGNITSDGGSTVTQRGVCWSTNQNPTIADNITSNGSGSGSFTSYITSLNANTTYYSRAYATNGVGTAYGNQINFTTTNIGGSLPTLTTVSASNVTNNSAVSGGNITSDGGSTVTQRGVCWSTNQNPTIADNITSNGSGSGSFTSYITSLNANTTYYSRAYATNGVGTAYGNVLSFSTLDFSPCNITGVNSGNTPYDLTLIPSSNTFNFGDDITINMYHPYYQAGQASILLYKNEELIINLCSNCIFYGVGLGNYQHTITLPSSASISASNCYSIRVLGTSGGSNANLNISNPITIH